MALNLAPLNLELGHTWTLAIEEQYYLLWPPILILILRTLQPRKAVIIPVLLAMLSVLVRVTLWTQYGDFWRINAGLDAHADGLLLGSALGLIYTFDLFPSSQRVKIFSVLIFTFLCGILMYTTVIQIVSQEFLANIGVPLVEITILLLIILTVIQPVSTLVNLFEFKPLVWVGTISYGLYLWQVPVLVLFDIENLGIPVSLSIPIKVVLIFAVTILSYRYIERPILRFKSRFQRL